MLLASALEAEEQAVLNEQRFGEPVAWRGELDEDAQAVAGAHLKAGDLRAEGVVEVGAVDVDTEARLVAVL